MSEVPRTKYQAPIDRRQPADGSEGRSLHVYPFAERALRFARRVRAFIRQLRPDLSNTDGIRQVVRSSGSIGANYIEANDALGDKDLIHRLRIARKEAKETVYWLKLLEDTTAADLRHDREQLESEARELVRILSAMIRNRLNHQDRPAEPDPAGQAPDLSLENWP